MNILLVEDETPTLMVLERKISSLNLGHNIVSTACSYSDAILKVEKYSPDLIITDIKMPGKDGLTLIEAVKITHPHMLFVIISGHDEFCYAKQALKLNVDDYLLKPVNTQELYDVLTRCQEKFDELASSPKDNFFSLIDNLITPSLKHKLAQSDYMISYLVFNNFLKQAGSIIHPSAPNIPSSNIEQKIKEYFGVSAMCFNGLVSNEKIIIFPLDSKSYAKISNTWIELIELYCKKLNCQLNVQLSTKCNNINELGRYIKNCRNLLMERITPENSTIFEYSPTNSIVIKSKISPEFINAIINMITQGNTTFLKHKIDELFNYYATDNYPIYYIEKDISYLLESIQRRFNIQSVYEMDVNFYIENIMCFSNSYANIGDNLCTLIKEFFILESAVDDSCDATNQIALLAKSYIDDNLYQNLTLQDIADHLNVSHVYLCRIFKNKYNDSPINYVIKKKIDKAKCIMNELPNISVKEISNTLQFSDQYYFSKVFKKLVGQSPTEYKNSIQIKIPV